MSLSLEFQEGIGLLKHDDGKRNVFSPDAIRDFNEALDEVEAKSASLLWVGREGCFSAGFDLKVVTGGDADAAAAMVPAGQSVPPKEPRGQYWPMGQSPVHDDDV